MKNYMKRGAAFCAALMMSAAVGCGSETGSSSSESKAPTDSKAATTTTAPIVEDLGNLDLSDVTNVYDVPADFSLTVEAEEGELSGDAAVLEQAFLGDFTGSGFVSIAGSGDEVAIAVEVPSEGSYNITLRLAADAEGMSNLITVDGNALTSFTSQSTDFSDTVAENVLISSAGSHTIGVRGDKGHIYIDSITITPAAPLDLSQYK
ncbi:MAG: beta-mannosidase, partial [Ruminococcus sp.]|nr:beta-mannosidase [Ruminococcus sp.]